MTFQGDGTGTKASDNQKHPPLPCLRRVLTRPDERACRGSEERAETDDEIFEVHFL
jgi:hypothetical protein